MTNIKELKVITIHDLQVNYKKTMEAIENGEVKFIFYKKNYYRIEKMDLRNLLEGSN